MKTTSPLPRVIPIIYSIALSSCLLLDHTHAAAPDVKLYINDYNIESVNNKSTALLTIAENLLDNETPLRGVGFESHFIVDKRKTSRMVLRIQPGSIY